MDYRAVYRTRIHAHPPPLGDFPPGVAARRGGHSIISPRIREFLFLSGSRTGQTFACTPDSGGSSLSFSLFLAREPANVRENPLGRYRTPARAYLTIRGFSSSSNFIYLPFLLFGGFFLSLARSAFFNIIFGSIHTGYVKYCRDEIDSIQCSAFFRFVLP